jgi:hypothetical protein
LQAAAEAVVTPRVMLVVVALVVTEQELHQWVDLYLLQLQLVQLDLEVVLVLLVVTVVTLVLISLQQQLRPLEVVVVAV